METKRVKCHNCGLLMEYWTTSNSIECTRCKARVEVEPCEEIEEELIEE